MRMVVLSTTSLVTFVTSVMSPSCMRNLLWCGGGRTYSRVYLSSALAFLAVSLRDPACYECVPCRVRVRIGRELPRGRLQFYIFLPCRMFVVLIMHDDRAFKAMYRSTVQP
ncbi:hypothetical protein GGR52DRAFT_560867 [Hypoxylon sp. FL1284]|nr:hypothetical protein GGR52DRAFT_560867 [Hypoxylon sp. FL1284]